MGMSFSNDFPFHPIFNFIQANSRNDRPFYHICLLGINIKLREFLINWGQKHAELCDIELSEEDDEEESENTREENEYLAQKARLNELLKNTVQ